MKKSLAEMRDDEWLKVAWVEDALVADLLLRLKQVKPTPLPPPETSPSTPPKQALLLEWRVRQRRSKAMMTIQPKNRTPRCSPTTPLSFSGGATSVSGGGGGGIECGGGASTSGEGLLLHRGIEREFTSVSLPKSAPKSLDMIRSKVDGSSESKTTRRSRKKKLQKLADLKAEEELLARERKQLQKELESVRMNLERERARNHNFKRMKFQHMASVHHPAPVASPPIIAGDVIHLKHSSASEPRKEGVCKFLLPDLNLPSEE